MKKAVVLLRGFILICMPFVAAGQQRCFIVDMDSVSADYKITHFTLSTQELYGIDLDIDVFNVLPILKENPRFDSEYLMAPTRYLFTFSVLPVFDGKSKWIEYDQKPDDIDYLSFERLQTLGRKTLHDLPYVDVPAQYGILFKKGNKYYRSRASFLQVFYVQDYPDVFTIPRHVIDINQPLLTIKQMKGIYENEFKGGEFPIVPGVYARKYDNYSLERFYLSSKPALQNGEVGYQFWTFVPWGRVMDDHEWERGIDRFVYVPGKGIVGGSYDFYFKDPLSREYKPVARRKINMLEFKQNIFDEKVMLAKEVQ
ncbi:hypothetical protein [Sphingobacterium tabacisoli]|uniref:DUF4837 family protein n=1 Tax=Sphingobacterium tabacisoli TaxID=2044855 RepID=A0ABW5KZK0_9SPHI|nr:hypothetical protein [Sphingobacterium tabacisoli]